MTDTYAATRQAHLSKMGTGNLAKRESALKELGDRYLLHPSKIIRRELPPPANIPARIRAPFPETAVSAKITKGK